MMMRPYSPGKHLTNFDWGLASCLHPPSECQDDGVDDDDHHDDRYDHDPPAGHKDDDDDIDSHTVADDDKEIRAADIWWLS